MTIRYVIARSYTGKPTVQHILVNNVKTLCGLNFYHASRAYQAEVLGPLLCRRCEKLS